MLDRAVPEAESAKLGSAGRWMGGHGPERDCKRGLLGNAAQRRIERLLVGVLRWNCGCANTPRRGHGPTHGFPYLPFK